MSNLVNYKKSSKNQIIVQSLIGIIAGMANGLFGGGGGMIVVPMLSMFLDFNSKQAHSTSILIILPLTLLSGAIYSSFVSLDYKVCSLTTLGVFIGGVMGSFLLKKLSIPAIVYIFSIIMFIVGIKFIFF